MNRAKRRQFLIATGALLAAPIARAQRARNVHRLGFFQQSPPGGALDLLRAALIELGWREEEIRFVTAVGGSDPARWDAIAQDLVRQHVDLIVVNGSHMALPLKRATDSVPLVMMTSGDPVEAGLVESLARPGGNVTGLRTFLDGMWGKFPDLLREAVPWMRDLGIVSDYAPPAFLQEEVEAGNRDLRRASQVLDVRLWEWWVRNDAELVRALAQAGNAPVDALLVTNGPTNGQPRNRPRIKELVLRRKLPMMSDIAGSVFREGGGLMAYAVSWKEIAARTAWYVDKILKGAKPADLPIEQPTRLPLVVNMKTAKAIGLTIPPSIMLRADRVIE